MWREALAGRLSGKAKDSATAWLFAVLIIWKKKRGIFMGEIIEEFFNGYCRNFDMTQTVICEFEQFPEGLRLLDSSCEYGVCQYSKDCTLMKQALAREKE